MTRAAIIVPLILAVLLAALVALPWYVPFFYIFVATHILIMGLFAASFNLVFGYSGMLSFGHAAFFGMGAYTAAMLMLHLHMPFIPVLIIAMITSGLLALVIGFLSVRLDEIYFAMLTLAFGMMAYAVVHQWRSVTNGSDGISGFAITPLLPGIHLQLINPVMYYFLVLVLVAMAAGVLYLITRSHFGLILQAIRQNPERVGFCGIRVRGHRLVAFVISGMFSGLAGALFAPFNHLASPSLVHWTQSAEPVLMSILGGAGYFLGPFFGAAIFVLLETWITSYTQYWMLALGIILAVMVLFFRRGLLGTVLDRLLERR